MTGNTEAVNVSFNQNLFTVLNENVPSQQEYTFGLNLAGDDFQIALEEFEAVEQYMNLSRLIAYELGNEPDFYYTHKTYRSASWDVFSYATQSVDWLLELTASLGSQASGFPGYMYGSMANPIVSQGEFTVGTFIKLGIPQIVKPIKIFSLHNYFGDACTRTCSIFNAYLALALIKNFHFQPRMQQQLLCHFCLIMSTL